MGTTSITLLGNIRSYKGDLRALVNYEPADVKELFGPVFVPGSTIRRWVREASEYHDVPLALSCAILQQENGPNATRFQKAGQAVERLLQTAGAMVDEGIGIVPDKFAGGSSGIANLSRKTLRDAADYVEREYAKPVMPAEVKVRLLGGNVDLRIQGLDLRADLYYLAAHLRQLIDRIAGSKRYHGPLTFDQVEKIAAAYNGSGPLARKYGKDTIDRITKAVAGTEPLYFYELAD